MEDEKKLASGGAEGGGAGLEEGGAEWQPAGRVPISPLLARAFDFIFGKEESKPATLDLTNAVLARFGLEPIGEIDAIDAEHTALGGAVECKMPRMDVRIVAERRSRVVDLEPQRYPDDVDNRSLLYGAQSLCENTPAGVGYGELPQVVVITLLDAAPLFPGAEGYAHACRMRWEVDGEEVPGTDRMLFVVVELRKVRERYNSLSQEVLGDALLSWCYLLTQGYESREEVDMIAERMPAARDFAKMYDLAVEDPKVKRAHEDAVSAGREYDSYQRHLRRLARENEERMAQANRDNEERMAQATRENEERMAQANRDNEARMAQANLENEERMAQRLREVEQQAERILREAEERAERLLRDAGQAQPEPPAPGGRPGGSERGEGDPGGA